LGDRDKRVKVCQAEGFGILPNSIPVLVRAGHGHIVERAVHALVLPDARLDAAAAKRGDRLGFLVLRCHGVSPLVKVDVLASHEVVEATQRRQRRQRGRRHLAGRWARCGGMTVKDDANVRGVRA